MNKGTVPHNTITYNHYYKNPKSVIITEKIKGYRTLSAEEIETINDIKALSSKCGKLIDDLQNMQSNDQRCISIGKTKLQEGFMWAVRGVAQPEGF